MYGKASHFPIELKHKALWALKKLNVGWKDAGKSTLNRINELDKFQLPTYESSAIYKEKIKLHHDRKTEKRLFEKVDQLLLYNSKFNLFPSKLRLRWHGLFMILKVYPYGALELNRDGDILFKISGPRVKNYMENIEEVNEVADIDLDKV